ncbi:endonuclease V [Candidatus Woesearchaeota archaeon]|nr:endonuclease V [Candidatus Woesearchaeota archaeon]
MAFQNNEKLLPRQAAAQGFDIKKLVKEQLLLSKKIVLKDQLPKNLERVAGCDVSFVNNTAVAAVVVTDVQDFKILEKALFVGKPLIPYIPGFLSYREAPLIVRAFQKLKQKPDLLLVDGNGVLHPRMMGIATHLGLLLDMPTIGVAKKLLLGVVDDKGFVVFKNKRLAYFLQTRPYSKPVIVSPGFKITLQTAIKLVSKMIKYPHKLPEPLHLAHRLAKTTAKKQAAKKKKLVRKNTNE